MTLHELLLPKCYKCWAVRLFLLLALIGGIVVVKEWKTSIDQSLTVSNRSITHLPLPYKPLQC